MVLMLMRGLLRTTGALLALGLIGLVVSPSRAHAHEWYSYECCASGDCQAAQEGTVEQLPDGRWRADGYTFRRDQVHSSQDGRTHTCVGARGGVKPVVRCIYIPLGS